MTFLGIPTSFVLALSLAALFAFGLVWWIWRGEKRREPVRVVTLPPNIGMPPARQRK